MNCLRNAILIRTMNTNPNFLKQKLSFLQIVMDRNQNIQKKTWTIEMKSIKFVKVVILILFVLFSFQSCESQTKEIKTIRHERIPAEKIIAQNQLAYNSENEIDDSYVNINLSRRNAITNAVERCSPAIVGINVTELVQVEYQNPLFNDPWIRRYFRMKPRVKQYKVQGLGSGFIISPDGYILTNHHVAGNAMKIIVTTSGGKKYDAKIIGADRVTDVALLKIDAKNMSFLEFGNSNNIIIGEWVIAFGNPFGLFDLNARPTVTVGVISNCGVDFIQEERIYKGMIQTDAAISSGNSGGPLVNALGEVIGMNTIIFSTAQSSSGAGSIGIGWALPINRVKKIMKELKTKGNIARTVELGLELKEINQQIANYLRLETNQGIVVIAVHRGSFSESAGIEPGDVITKINNREIFTKDDYFFAIYDTFAGEDKVFELLRGDKKLTKTIHE